MKKIAQIIIGDEILAGKIQDLNLKQMAEQFLPSSYKFQSATFIGDNENLIVETLEAMARKNDVLILTGGLGPTRDDLTKEVLGLFINGQKSLHENSNAKELAISHYQRLKREWSPELNNYHMLPENIEALYNPVGFAPGLYTEYKFNNHTCFIFAAPGVPREFQGMLKEVIIPMIEKKVQTFELGHELFNIRTYGVAEEVIFGKLCPTLWSDLEIFGKVSSLPNWMGVDITLTLKKDNNLEFNKEQIRKIISHTAIKDNIWHIGLESLPEVIVKEASAKNLTFSFAESCTGGLASSLITDISGSSKCFLGAVVSYANEVKMKQLDVKEETLNTFGAVSIETAHEMALGARVNLKTDLSVSFSGIAGPLGGSDKKPVGTVAIGLSTSEKTESEILQYSGDRERLKFRFAMAGLFKLLFAIRRA